MTRFFTLLLFCFTVCFNTWAQTLTITAPTNGATGVSLSPTVTARSTSTGNSDTDPDVIYVEVSDNPDFDGSGYYSSSTDYERIIDSPENIDNVFPGLAGGTVYYVRAYSYKFDEYSTTISFTTLTTTVSDQVLLRFVGTGSAALATGAIGAGAYANTYVVSLRLNATAANATSYDWQFDSVSSAFSNVSATLNSTTTTLTFNADASNFRSGRTYFVRARGKNTTSTGPWSTVANTRRFVNSLHPTVLSSPTGGIGRTAFKIWTHQVANATRYYFQVDDDPTFATPLSLSGFNSYKNETVTGITGNIFRANYTVGSNPGYSAFDYITELLQGTTYYVRVRAWNANQAGYWHTVNNVTPAPTRTVTFTSPTNGATGTATGIQFTFSDDPNYAETGYDFQLSRDGFTTTDINVSNQAPRRYFADNLRYATTYSARVRSYATGDASPSAWTTISFTTKAAPAMAVTFPTGGMELPNVNVNFYSTWEGGIATYDWQLEKLNAPTSSFSNSTATYKNSFTGYLALGGSYRVRVRGISALGVTGAYSAWVNFTVAAVSPSHAITRLGDESALVAIAYPNPFMEDVTITNPTGSSRNVTIVDAAGRILVRTIITGTEAQVGQGLAPGIYQVILSGTEGLPVERIRIVRQ